MSKVILEFTLRGHKHTFYRRTSLFGEALTTTNINSAKKLKESDVSTIVKKLIEQYGKDNIADVKQIKDDT